jgi:hypothetical protein
MLHERCKMLVYVNGAAWQQWSNLWTGAWCFLRAFLSSVPDFASLAPETNQHGKTGKSLQRDKSP